MRPIAFLALLLLPAVAQDDPNRYDSMWDGLNERVDAILALKSPWRENAMRQYHVCIEKLGNWCELKDAYREMSIARAKGAEVSEESLRALSDAIDRAWHEYHAARGELEHRIVEGAVASRGEEVRPDEPPPGKEAEVPEVETPPDPELPGGPTPPDPPVSAGPAASQVSWAAREKRIFEALSSAAKAVLRPAFDAVLASVDSLANAAALYLAARDENERGRLRAQLRDLQREFAQKRNAYGVAKAKAQRGGDPLEGYLGGAGAAGERLAALGSLVARAAQAGASETLASDLRALANESAEQARARGERLARLLAPR